MIKKLNNINVMYIIIFIFLSFLSSVFLTFRMISSRVYAYTLYTTGIISLLLIILNFIKNKEHLKLCDIIILFLAILAIISTCFAKNISVSIFGFRNWNEGLLSLLTYYSLFSLSTFIKNKDKEFIMNMLLFLGVFQVFYGLFQVLGIFESVHDGTRYAGGLVGNSMFFGTQNVLWLALSIGLYSFSSNRNYIIYIFIFSLGIFLSGSMSAVVGTGGVILSYIIYLLYLKYKRNEVKPYLKKLTIVLISLFISLIVGTFINHLLFEDIKEMIFQLFNITVNKEVMDNYGTNRIYIWKNVLKVVPKHLLHGVGIDCFAYAFPKGLLLPSSILLLVDKAHNEFLQILLTQGIFALLTYISFLLIIIKNCTKKLVKENYIKMALFLAIIGYLTQSCFNISVITVAPLFYIILGLAYNRGNDDEAIS